MKNLSSWMGSLTGTGLLGGWYIHIGPPRPHVWEQGREYLWFFGFCFVFFGLIGVLAEQSSPD